MFASVNLTENTKTKSRFIRTLTLLGKWWQQCEAAACLSCGWVGLACALQHCAWLGLLLQHWRSLRPQRTCSVVVLIIGSSSSSCSSSPHSLAMHSACATRGNARHPLPGIVAAAHSLRAMHPSPPAQIMRLQSCAVAGSADSLQMF